MDGLNIIFIIFGLLLIITEFIIPSGGILSSAALSFITLVLVRYFGFTNNFIYLALIWILVILGFSVLFSLFANKLLAGGIHKKKFNELQEAIGLEVDVISTVSILKEDGRIFFQGTTWNAYSEGETIEAGSKAVIIAKDDIWWIVKAKN